MSVFCLQGFPIIFHSVQQIEGFETGGHSCKNDAEAQIVLDYINDLLQSTDVIHEQIGVITPYTLQVEHFRARDYIPQLLLLGPDH